MKSWAILFAFFGAIYGLTSPALFIIPILVLLYFAVEPHGRITRQLRSMRKHGFTASHFFLATTPSAKAPARAVAVDQRGRVAVHENGRWEGVELLDVSLMPHEDVTVHTTGSRSLMGAIVGGFIAGPVGAIVGGSGSATRSFEKRDLRSIDLVLIVNCIDRPVRVLSFDRDMDCAKRWHARLVAAQRTRGLR